MPDNNDQYKKYLDYDGLDYLIQRIPRTKIKVTFDDVFAGETATCSMGTTTYTKTVPATEPYELVFPINELGTWTIETSYLGDDYGTTIEVTAIGQTATGHVSYITEIDGATVTPTDDITTWLKCANIEDASITTLADVLANRSLFETLIANSNACKYMARSTSLALAEGAVPTMTDNTHPSGECFGSTQHDANSTYFKAFDGDSTTSWFCHDSEYGTTDQAYVGYDFGEPVIFNRATYSVYAGTSIEEKIIASNDKSTWTVVSDTKTTATGTFDINTNGVPYRYYAIRGSMTFSSTRVNQVYDLQFYEADITTSQDAMALIGKYDYCSNELLSNATWASAIANSDYFEEVLNVKVPKLTADSSSVITNLSLKASGFEKWKSFDGDTTKGFYWSYTPSMSDGWFGYDFGSPVKISRVDIFQVSNTASIKTTNVQYSDDGTTWTNATETLNLVSGYGSWQTFEIPASIGAHRYWCLGNIMNNGDGGGCYNQELQFYGRASAQTNIIHSAPNDTIYMLENGSQVVLTTTNSDGDGILDFTQFMDGTYTLYSSVAKDPNNLSNDYSKSIRITKTSYGCTAEAYLMPDTVKTLYWFGYEGSDLEDCCSANGWAGDESYGYNLPTHNINYIDMLATGSATTALCAVGSKKSVSGTKLHAIGRVVSDVLNMAGIVLRNNKSGYPFPTSSFAKSANMQHITADFTNNFVVAMSRLSTTVRLDAFWYE